MINLKIVIEREWYLRWKKSVLTIYSFLLFQTPSQAFPNVVDIPVIPVRLLKATKQEVPWIGVSSKFVMYKLADFAARRNE